MTCQPDDGVKPQAGAGMAREIQRIERNAARGAFLAIRPTRRCQPNYRRIPSRCRTNGGSGGIRTHDQRLKRALLYR